MTTNLSFNCIIKSVARRSSRAFACGLLAIIPFFAIAQQAPAPQTALVEAGDEIQELVVTAQRREERMMSVPVAVSAVSGETLSDLGISRTRDIIEVLPGIEMNDGGPNSSFAIRGVSLNDTGDSNESPIAMYQDDVYIAALGGAQSQMFDVSRVEVERGPQGTLFGRNANGGVVQVISNKPTNTFYGDMSVEYGSYDQVIATGAISGPLGPDNVRGRLAFNYDRDSGWQQNVVTDTRTGISNDWAFRGLLDIDVTSQLFLELNAHMGENNDIHALYGGRGAYDYATGTWNPATYTATGQYCTQAQVLALAPQCTTFNGFRDPNPTPTTVYSSLSAPRNEIHNRGTSATLKYSGTDFNLTSVSAFEDTSKLYQEDADPNPVPIYVDPWGATRAQLSQEIRASGEPGPMKWTTGLYYFEEHLTDGFFIGGTNLIPIFGTLDTSNYFTERTSAGAGFGQVDYDIAPKLTVTAGARYSQETKTLHITDSLTAPNYHEEDVSHSHAPTWKLGVSSKFLQDWLAYASLSTGFKSPGFNTTGVGPGGSVASQPEHLTSYEVGVKGSMWNDRLQITPTVYYNHYKDFQIIDAVPVGLFPVTRLTNVPLAKIVGGEIDVVFRPIEHLYVDVNGTVTKSKIHAPDTYLGALLLDGLAVTNTPERTAKASIEYRIDTLSSGRFTPRVSGTTQTKFYPLLSCYLYYSCAVPGYTLVNGSLEWTPPSRNYHIEVSAKNILNKIYQNGGFSFADQSVMVWGQPRWLGIRVYTEWK